MNNQKKIFISHSTKDKALAEIVVELLAACGISKDDIFCSSYQDTAAKQQISVEIKKALSHSKLDIILFSNDYKKSEYCLNEAGIIWYKSDNYKLIISLPEISDKSVTGFISKDYIQYRLENDDFCNTFFKRLREILSEFRVAEPTGALDIIKENFARQISEYKKRLPITANLSINNKKTSSEQHAKASAKTAQSNIIDMACYNYKQQQPMVFYEYYTRHIDLKAIEPGKIEVKTITDCVIVNLVDEPYNERFSSQFLRENGGFETFSNSLSIDGEIVSLDNAESTPNKCPYIITDTGEIIIRPHSRVEIQYITSYQIAPERFFQSKLVKIPCGSYNIRANFDKDFAKIMKRDYIFRFQIIPCVPRDLSCGVVPVSEYVEDEDKHYVSYSAKDGFPAGGGYVLVINKN